MTEPDSPTRSVRCVVSGRVQGVFYRASTQQRAEQLRLDGWAKNLPDGTVEVVVSGDESEVSALTAWLWEGSPSARVTAVTVEEFPDDVPAGFHTD